MSQDVSNINRFLEQREDEKNDSLKSLRERNKNALVKVEIQEIPFESIKKRHGESIRKVREIVREHNIKHGYIPSKEKVQELLEEEGVGHLSDIENVYNTIIPPENNIHTKEKHDNEEEFKSRERELEETLSIDLEEITRELENEQPVEREVIEQETQQETQQEFTQEVSEPTVVEEEPIERPVEEVFDDEVELSNDDTQPSDEETQIIIGGIKREYQEEMKKETSIWGKIKRVIFG